MALDLSCFFLAEVVAVFKFAREALFAADCALAAAALVPDVARGLVAFCAETARGLVAGIRIWSPVVAVVEFMLEFVEFKAEFAVVVEFSPEFEAFAPEFSVEFAAALAAWSEPTAKNAVMRKALSFVIVNPFISKSTFPSRCFGLNLAHPAIVAK